MLLVTKLKLNVSKTKQRVGTYPTLINTDTMDLHIGQIITGNEYCFQGRVEITGMSALLNSMSWQREVIVASNFFELVEVKIRYVLIGGSSSVFKNALKAD